MNAQQVNMNAIKALLINHQVTKGNEYRKINIDIGGGDIASLFIGNQAYFKLIELLGLPLSDLEINECKGKNCKSINGFDHSEDCIKEHDKNTNIDSTAGSRNPQHRYAGYKGHDLPDNSNKDQIDAYNQGVNAREVKRCNVD